MRPNLIDTLARAAVSRAGRMPPARDALAGRRDADLTAHSPTASRVAAARVAPTEATISILREPPCPPKARPSRLPTRGVPSRAAGARTPPKLDLGSYLERRRGRP